MKNSNFRSERTIEKGRRSHRKGAKEASLLQFMELTIQELRQEQRPGTATNYEQARRSLARFLQGRELSFGALDARLIEEYNRYLLGRGLLRNTTSFYMRILRAVCNRASRAGFHVRNNLFENVYTGVDKTRKRAVKERVIQELNALELKPGSELDFARDLFLFSYCTRGMAYVDMVHLRCSEVRAGVIRYARQKSGQELVISIEKPVERVIRKYSRVGARYLFPVLKGESVEEDYRRYRQGLNDYNRSLKKLGERLSERVHLSSYMARHSWATAARNHRFPLSVISAALGHTSEQTTQIYLASLEGNVVDMANHELVKQIHCTAQKNSVSTSL